MGYGERPSTLADRQFEKPLEMRSFSLAESGPKIVVFQNADDWNNAARASAGSLHIAPHEVTSPTFHPAIRGRVAQI
jgi:hypothetical protein